MAGTVMKKCPLCGKETPADENFCRNCRYPINVRKVNDFSRKEMLAQLADLSEAMANKEGFFGNKELDEIYNELVWLHWLRPESALLRFLEARILLGMREKYLRYPMLDLGCGEGLFTSVLFGARVNKEYDAFECVDFSQTDVYNDAKQLPEDLLEKRPRKIGFGVDIKENMVGKANALGTFEEVKQADLRALPFEAGTMGSVFTNMIDDIRENDLERVLLEVNRVLKKGSCFVFVTPAKNFREFLLYHNRAIGAEKRGDLDAAGTFRAFDRGRSEWEPRPKEFWKRLFKKTGFEMLEFREYGSRGMLRFWDTGFRPFFFQLMSARGILRKGGALVPVKAMYAELMKAYLLRFAAEKLRGNGAFAIVVAKKNWLAQSAREKARPN